METGWNVYSLNVESIMVRQAWGKEPRIDSRTVSKELWSHLRESFTGIGIWGTEDPLLEDSTGCTQRKMQILEQTITSRYPVRSRRMWGEPSDVAATQPHPAWVCPGSAVLSAGNFSSVLLYSIDLGWAIGLHDYSYRNVISNVAVLLCLPPRMIEMGHNSWLPTHF